MTVEEIKASNKQEVHAPMNFHKLHEHLLMFTTTNDIIFGSFNMGSQYLQALTNMMNQHKSTFKAKECLCLC
jgi:hypothetical protein